MYSKNRDQNPGSYYANEKISQILVIISNSIYNFGES